MKVGTKEFYEIMSNLERNFSHLRLDKEPRESWDSCVIYQNGETNRLFNVFLMGYAMGRVSYMQ